MRALFLRDVRRLAPLAATLFLGTLVFLFVAPLFGITKPAAVLGVSLLVSALLLAVASVAPDTDSGAIAFLARLPISPWKGLAAKTGAALLWVGVLVAALGVVSPKDVVELKRSREWIDLFAISFACGLFSSVVVKRALGAVATGPIVAGIALFSFTVPTVYFLSMRSISGDTIVRAAAGALVAIAFLAYARGDRHRDSWRPALLGLGSVFLLVVVALSGMALAHGWSIHDAPHWLEADEQGRTPLESPDQRYFALGFGGSNLGGYEERIVLTDRSSGRAWLLPVRYASSWGFSPSGKHFLARANERPGGWLVDVEKRSVEPLGPAWSDATVGFGAQRILWRGERPLFLRAGEHALEVNAAGGKAEARFTLRAGMHLDAVVSERGLTTVGDERVVLHDGSSIVTMDPWRGRSETVFTAEEGWTLEEVATSRKGDHALVLVAREPDERLLALDLGTRDVHAINGDSRVVHGDLWRSVFSPDETKAAIVHRTGVFVFDLASHRMSAFEHASDGMEDYLAWSPDGRLLALPWRETVEVASGTRHAIARRIAAFVAPGAAVEAGAPYSVVDLATGVSTRRPLEER